MPSGCCGTPPNIRSCVLPFRQNEPLGPVETLRSTGRICQQKTIIYPGLGPSGENDESRAGARAESQVSTVKGLVTRGRVTTHGCSKICKGSWAGESMLIRLLVGLLLISFPSLYAGDTNTGHDTDAQPVANKSQPEGSSSVCGGADQFITVIIFGDSRDTVCSVSYTNNQNAPTDGVCNKSAFPPGCRSYLGGLVLSIGRWAQKTDNPMVEQVLDNLGLSELISVGGLFLDVAEGSFIRQLPFLQGLRTITDTGLQVLGSPTLDGLPGLAQVAAIDGHVFLVQTGMPTLASLNAVSTIGRSMVLIGNHNLTDLSGMDRLSSVGGPLMLADNSKLRNLTGLGRLVAVGIDPTASGFTGLSISRNGQLANLQGLNSLVSIGGPLSIMDNPRLTSLDGLQSLSAINALGQSLSGVLHVAYNWRLQDISALRGLARCSGGISLHEAAAPNMTVEVYPQRHTLQRPPTGAFAPSPATLAPAPAGPTTSPLREMKTKVNTSVQPADAHYTGPDIALRPAEAPTAAGVRIPNEATKPAPAPGTSVAAPQATKGGSLPQGPSPMAGKAGAPHGAHVRRHSRKKGHKKAPATPAPAPADSDTGAGAPEAESNAVDAVDGGRDEKQAPAGPAYKGSEGDTADSAKVASPKGAEAGPGNAPKARPKEKHGPGGPTRKKKRKSTPPPTDAAAPGEGTPDALHAPAQSRASDDTAAKDDASNAGQGSRAGVGGAGERQSVTPEVTPETVDTDSGKDDAGDEEKVVEAAAAPAHETQSASGQAPPAWNNGASQQRPLQQTLQSILPQFTLPNLPTAQTGLGALGGNFRWPFQLAAMANGSGYANVTYEQLAEALAESNGNWTAVMPLLASIGNETDSGRLGPGNAWVVSRHDSIPPGFLDLVGDPTTSNRFLEIVGESEGGHGIVPITSRHLPHVESYLTRSSEQRIRGSAAHEEAALASAEQGPGPMGRGEGITSLVTQRVSEMPSEDLTLDLFIEQPQGNNNAQDQPLASAAPGPAPGGSDLVVYRCTLETWDDICRYIAAPGSVDEGTDWITKGTCGQVFPALPGAAPITGPRL